MSRPTAVPLPRGVLGGPRAAAPPVRLLLPWGLVGAAVLVQIVYPLVADAVRAEITVASVLVFCAASGVSLTTGPSKKIRVPIRSA